MPPMSGRWKTGVDGQRLGHPNRQFFFFHFFAHLRFVSSSRYKR